MHLTVFVHPELTVVAGVVVLSGTILADQGEHLAGIVGWCFGSPIVERLGEGGRVGVQCRGDICQLKLDLGLRVVGGRSLRHFPRELSKCVGADKEQHHAKCPLEC